MKGTLPFSCIFFTVMLLLGLASSDLNQDRAECANQLVALATCLPYVGGQARTPTIDCCTGLKQILGKSRKCLCILIKDRDDPNLGLKINATLAATLPNTCHASANVTECISLLHLSPNSADAKMFKGFANITQGHSNSTATSGTSSASSTSAQEKSSSDGRKGKRLTLGGVEMVCGILLWIFTSHHLNF